MPAKARADGADAETWGEQLRRRLRDLMIMGVVGPAMGVAAIVAVHVATVRVPPAAPPAHAAGIGTVPLVATTLAPVLPPPLPQPPALTQADFRDIQPTDDARHMADWVVGRDDNGKMPFMVLDKRAARLYVFHPNGELVEDTYVLLGSARGDDTFPGIGNVPIKDVKPYQRTTAAGRFVTQPGLDIDRTDVVWLDYDAALAMHRVINKVKAERRLQRIVSTRAADHRISYGCINIPIDFFDRDISPVFGHQHGVVYVIPEKKTFAEVFESGTPPTLASAAPIPAATAKPPVDIGSR